MGILQLLLHLANFVLPAFALATLLAPAAIGWRGLLAPGGAARLRRVWALLAGAGILVLAAGLVAFGRDGKVATYAALVIVSGTLGWALQRRRQPQPEPRAEWQPVRDGR